MFCILIEMTQVVPLSCKSLTQVLGLTVCLVAEFSKKWIFLCQQCLHIFHWYCNNSWVNKWIQRIYSLWEEGDHHDATRDIVICSQTWVWRAPGRKPSPRGACQPPRPNSRRWASHAQATQTQLPAQSPPHTEMLCLLGVSELPPVPTGRHNQTLHHCYFDTRLLSLC